MVLLNIFCLECLLLIVPHSNAILVNALRNFERVFGFTQLITEPTRVCNNCESAINLSF